MTTIPLHDMPRWRTVAAEQIRAVGLMTRKAGVALTALLLFLVVMVLQASFRDRSLERLHLRSSMLEIAAAPWAAIGAMIAALFAIAMWRDDDPDRRSYHWMMPVEPHVHTLTKALAGLVWMLAATIVSLVCIALLGVVSSLITGQALPSEIAGWSFWIVPVTSVAVAYVLVSTAAVGTRQPVIWVLGVILLYSGTLLGLDVLGYRDTHDVVRLALTGEYGIGAAVAGTIDRLDTAHLRSVPSVSRWLGAFGLWGGLGALLLVATSYRRAEPTVVGSHGPFRRAISGHRWLVASVIALSVAVGLVAARVMKPEYEARATIWNSPRASSNIAVMTPDQQPRRAVDQVDLLRSWRIADTVVRSLALYVRPENAADTSLLKGFSIADRFIPGDYRLAVDDRGTRWQLNINDAMISDSGTVGDPIGNSDSVGHNMGLRWRPEAATLARYAGREVRFSVSTPRETSIDLQTRLVIVQPANGSFLQLSLTDPDPHRAARTVNAVANAYIAKTRELTGVSKSVLDSAAAPAQPFKNSPAQLFGLWVAIGISAAIGLAFAASAFEGRVRPERIEGSDWLSQAHAEMMEPE